MSQDAIFDRGGAFDRVDGDTELLFELVSMFFETYEANVNKMLTAVSSSDGDSLEQIAHSMKSALGNLGAMKSFQLALQLESAGKNGSLDGCEDLISQLKQSVVEFNTAIEALKAS